MRALTLRLPWAVLVVTGRKPLESRKGPVLNRHTGVFAVHVSKRSPGWRAELERLAGLYPLTVEDMTNPYGIDDTDDLAGHIIGTVVAGRTHQDVPFFRAGDRERDAAVFDTLMGRYLTELTDPRWLPAPVPYRGRLGLWPAPDVAA